MFQWMQQTLSADASGFATLPAAFLLGLLGSVSSCCTLPVVSALAGYAGSLKASPNRRHLLFIGLSLMLGTALALALIGAVTGFLGQMAGTALGRYWRLLGGLMMVVFGLSSLGWLKLHLPKVKAGAHLLESGAVGALLYGLVVGGATVACSVCCNPVLPAAVGAIALKGAPLLGATLLATFALGYSLPLAAGVVGIRFGLGKLGVVAGRVMPIVQAGFGLLLIGVGFYLLASG